MSMRERAHSVGGTLHADPRSEGGSKSLPSCRCSPASRGLTRPTPSLDHALSSYSGRSAPATTAPPTSSRSVASPERLGDLRLGHVHEVPQDEGAGGVQGRHRGTTLARLAPHATGLHRADSRQPQCQACRGERRAADLTRIEEILPHGAYGPRFMEAQDPS